MAGASPHQDPAIGAFFAALGASNPTNPRASSKLPAFVPKSDAELIQAWANERPGMGWGEDAGRSAVTGLQRGVTGMIGLPDAIQGLYQKAQDFGADIGARMVGHAPMTPQQHAELRAAMNGPLPLAPAVLANVQNHAVNSATGHPGALPEGTTHPLPTTAGLDQAAQAMFGPYHTPQTWQGRTAQTLGEMAPNALLPGGAVARVARVLVPTATSSGAGELAHGTKYEGAARMAGGMAGGLMEGLGEGAFSAPERTIGSATRGLTPDQIDQAVALRQSAADQGIQLTIPEAVQQVTNGASGLGRVQRLVENANRTSPDMAAYFADRPDQIRGAVENFVGDVAPNMPQQPGMIGLDAQRAAEGAQMAANSARSAIAGPHYAAADAQAVDRNAMADILDNIDTQIGADRTGLVAPKLAQLRNSLTETAASPGVPATRTPVDAPNGQIFHVDPGSPGTGRIPITNIGNLSTARNYWRDVIDNPPVGVDPLTKYQSGIIGNHLDDLDALLRANPHRQLGDAAFADASRHIVDPVNAGPVGAIARTADLGGQTAALFPANPPLGHAGESAAALGAIDPANEGLAAALTGQHVGNTFNTSMRNLSGGPNQYGGALFAKNIAGNAEQARTLDAALGQLDPSGELAGRFGDLVDALQATGRRERPGSMTAFNAEDLNALKLAPEGVRFLGGLGDPLEWTKNLSNWTGSKLYGRNLDILRSMIVDPDTAAILQRAAAAHAPVPVPPQALLPAFAAAQGGDQ